MSSRAHKKPRLEKLRMLAANTALFDIARTAYGERFIMLALFAGMRPVGGPMRRGTITMRPALERLGSVRYDISPLEDLISRTPIEDAAREAWRVMQQVASTL